MMKLTLALAATFAVGLIGFPAAAAPAGGVAVEALVRGDLPTDFVQYRRFGHRHGFRGGHRFRRGYGYRRGHGHRRAGVGAAVGAGVVGLAAGAIIGGAIANAQAQAAPRGVSADAVAACARRFRSYDASSGTYLGHDGDRHACP